MTDFTKRESMERFCEGLKRAASCAREFAAGSHNMQWMEVALLLDSIRKNGEKLETLKALNPQQTEAVINKVQRDQEVENAIKQGRLPVVH